MMLEKGKITPVQLMFATACFIQASSLLSAFLVGVTAADSWIAVILGIIACIPLLMIYIGLLKLYPGKNLVEINQLSYGKMIGTAVSLLQIVFILTLASLNLRDLDVFVKETIMDKTPDFVLMISCILVCALAIHYGIEVTLRYGFMFVLLSGFVLLISLVLAINLMDLNNFLPMFQLPPIKYVQGANVVLSIPFGELFIFLMIAPYVHEKNRKFGRYFVGGFLLGSILFLLVVFRDTAVLGNTMGLYALPAFETLRLITLFGSISRVEILFAAVLIALLFFKISVLYYALVLAVAQLFNMKSYRPIILVTGILIIGYSFTLYPSNVQHANSGRETSTILWQVFETVIPLFALILGAIKKKKRKDVQA